MLDMEDNGQFGTINNGLENKMTCGSGSYPRTKDKTMRILKNYHVSKQHMQSTKVKEEVDFTQTSIDTKANNINKKV